MQIYLARQVVTMRGQWYFDLRTTTDIAKEKRPVITTGLGWGKSIAIKSALLL